MISRRTESTNLLWGRRQQRSGRNAHHERPVVAAGGEVTGGPAGNPPARRQGGPCQDQALYACGCGCVFPALVSTSVDCPGCGSTQAW